MNSAVVSCRINGVGENQCVSTCVDGEHLVVGNEYLHFFERGMDMYKKAGKTKISGT